MRFLAFAFGCLLALVGREAASIPDVTLAPGQLEQLFLYRPVSDTVTENLYLDFERREWFFYKTEVERTSTFSGSLRGPGEIMPYGTIRYLDGHTFRKHGLARGELLELLAKDGGFIFKGKVLSGQNSGSELISGFNPVTYEARVRWVGPSGNFSSDQPWEVAHVTSHGLGFEPWLRRFYLLRVKDAISVYRKHWWQLAPIGRKNAKLAEGLRRQVSG